MARLYPRAFVQSIVAQTGLSEAEVLQIIEQQRDDIIAVKTWVDANAGLQGTTTEETIANAWQPGDPPVNADAVVAVAAAARVVIAIEES